MKVSEAIKVLTQTLHQYEKHLLSGQRDAVKLGIEALKFWKDLQDRGALPSNTRLPGETPEEET